MKTSIKLSLTAAALVLTGIISVRAESNSANFPRALTLAPAESGGADAASSGSESSSDAELLKKLSNPVSSLISVPFQNNFDFGGGPSDDGFRYTMNFQPVVPISISENWNVIIRTILPFIHQSDVVNNGTQSGLGDTTQSFFLSPKKPWNGMVLGVGPALLYPSATDDLLGSGKVGAGPTVVALTQQHGLTVGILANHIWSFAGEGGRADVNQTFLQPFLSYNTKTKTTFTLNTESTYNWENSEWTVPLNLMVAQLVRIGKMPVSFQIGGRYYADKPSGGPDWGLRFAVTLLFPKK